MVKTFTILAWALGINFFCNTTYFEAYMYFLLKGKYIILYISDNSKIISSFLGGGV